MKPQIVWFIDVPLLLFYGIGFSPGEL